MFGWGKKNAGKRFRKRNRHRCHKCPKERSKINLNDAEENYNFIVLSNPDKKTMEMGIYKNSVIYVQRNDQNEPNIVVGVGESRYIIPRDIAKNIIVK